MVITAIPYPWVIHTFILCCTSLVTCGTPREDSPPCIDYQNSWRKVVTEVQLCCHFLWTPTIKGWCQMVGKAKSRKLLMSLERKLKSNCGLLLSVQGGSLLESCLKKVELQQGFSPGIPRHAVTDHTSSTGYPKWSLFIFYLTGCRRLGQPVPDLVYTGNHIRLAQ